MSTIEEALAQARETLADYQRANAGGYGAGNHTYLARALRVLLDATEPQETTTPAAKSQLEAVTNAIEKVLDGQGALHCTRVWEAWGYGTMSEDDFSPVTNDAEAVNEIASAVLEALGPRPITDEMVDAAAGADFEFGKESMTWADWGRANPEHAEWLRTKARAILEAAEGARR